MERQSRHQERRIIVNCAMAFILIILCAYSRNVLAQWTQPDANGHINNTNTGNVGVGTSAPATKLTVSTNTQTAPAGLNGTTAQIVAANGTPTRLLVDSFGAVSSSIDMRRANNTALSPTGLLNGDIIGQITWQGRGATSYNGNSRAKIIVNAAETYTDTAQGAFMTFHVAPTGGITAVEAMRIAATGFVGLGTTAPAYRLDVQSGSINASGGLCIAGVCKTDWSQVGGSQWANGSGFINYSSGYVGIGTATPSAAYKLDVQGGSINSSGGLCIAGVCKTDWSQVGGSQWSNGSSSIFYNAGNVGIGTTTSPTRRLEVLGGNVFHQWSTTPGSEYGFYTAMDNNHFASNLYFDGQWKMIKTGKGAVLTAAPVSGLALSVWADNTSRAANASASLVQSLSVTMDGKVGVGNSAPTYSLDVNGGINSFRAKAATASGSDVVAAFENNSGIQMIVRGNGNVGIGTTAPAKTLDVVGDINASGTITGGNIQAKYQDVAEWVESSEELPAGTVVILDSNRSNQVIASISAYDSRVAGVISLRPGIALGERGEGRVLVATTGRVKVKVDASNGPINIGDLLVTSDKTGLAMKSVPVEIGGVRIHRPGTLIGKALEPLAAGTGEILVLLSLQ